MNNASKEVALGASLAIGLSALIRGCFHDGAAIRALDHAAEFGGTKYAAHEFGAGLGSQAGDFRFNYGGFTHGDGFKPGFGFRPGEGFRPGFGYRPGKGFKPSFGFRPGEGFKPGQDGFMPDDLQFHGPVQVIAPRLYENPTDRKWQRLLAAVNKNPDSTRFFATNNIHAHAFANLAKTIHERSALRLAAIPRGRTEFHNIFGVYPTPREVAQMKLTVQMFESAGPQPTAIGSSKGFQAVLQSDDHTVIVIVGHNVKGRLMLADGESLDLNEMSEHCAAAAKICVFLSCSSDRYVRRNAVGAARTITFREAHKLTSKVDSLLHFAEREQVNYQTVARALPLLIREEQAASHIHLALTYSSVPTGFGLLTVAVNRWT